ncbi:tyrosine-type recombinase/integrase [bacterium]|nr:tyrosine-type recombinase/integrase [bacterium]
MDLREKFNGIRELRISLKTGVRSEAKRFAQILKYQLDKAFEDIRYGDNSTTCVSLIKQVLKEYLDEQLLPINRGISRINGVQYQFEPQNGYTPPQDLQKEMKLPSELKLMQMVVKRLKYADILEFCAEHGIKYSEDAFSQRHIRQARNTLLKLIEQQGLLFCLADALARDIIDNHLSSLDQTSFKQYMSELEISNWELQKLQEDNENLSVDDVLELIDETYEDLIDFAIEIGVNSLFVSDNEPVVKDTKMGAENDNAANNVWQKLNNPTVKEEVSNAETLLEDVKTSRSSEERVDHKPKQSPKISKVIEAYFEEMIAAKVWKPKSLLEKKTVIGKFIEIVGDITVDQLSFEIARKYKSILMKLPANMRKDQRYRDKSIKEILELEDVKPVAVNTVNNNITAVVALMTWARKNGYITENYFEGLKVVSKKKPQDERKVFSSKDIVKIFNPDTYLKETEISSARYWIPLLDMFTGARLNELCQLHTSDVKKEDDLWCLDINEKSDDPENPKSLKNRSSDRVIPIHLQLIELGFIDFVNTQKKAGHVRLFPELTLSIDGFSRKIGRWFNQTYLRKKAGIKDPEKSFHSFRHTVSDGLKQKRIQETFVSEYLGHSTGDSETYGRYGKKYQPEALMEEVVKYIDYELDFRLLRKSKQ